MAKCNQLTALTCCMANRVQRVNGLSCSYCHS